METYTAEELLSVVTEHGNWPELTDRVAEFLGKDWHFQKGREIVATIPNHCSRIDSETSYHWK
tara:strand:- start:69 stop:257 length:189 start_codon:yes stop_codon:yes gene_type:complete